MPIYRTAKVASTVQTRAGIDITAVYATYSLTVALALNDVIEMVKVPKGATILDVLVSSTDLDTGGGAIVFEVGDGGDPDRYVNAAGGTFGQAGGVVRLNAHSGLCYTYTTEDTIDLKCTTGPTTGAATGTITMAVTYQMQQ